MVGTTTEGRFGPPPPLKPQPAPVPVSTKPHMGMGPALPTAPAFRVYASARRQTSLTVAPGGAMTAADWVSSPRPEFPPLGEELQPLIVPASRASPANVE